MATDDLSLKIIVEMRDEMRGMGRRMEDMERRLSGQISDLRVDVGERLDAVNERIDGLDERMDGLEKKVEHLRAETMANFGGVLHVLGGVKVDIERRVSRIEDHLGLDRG